MGYFHVEVTFPTRLLNTEVHQHLKDEEYYDSGKALYTDKVSLLENCYTDKTETLIMIEADESGDGEIKELEALLKKNQIPYDRYCSEDDGYAADRMYYRPGKEDHIVKHSEGYEYIKVQDVQEALDRPNANLRTIMEQLMDINSSRKVEPIENFTTATPLGRNKTAMERIDDVLAKMDAEEITQTEAFAQIAKIKEEENDDKERLPVCG